MLKFLFNAMRRAHASMPLFADALAGMLLARLPLRYCEPIARTAWQVCALCRPASRVAGLIRVEQGVASLPPGRAGNLEAARYGAVLEKLIDLRMYYVRREARNWDGMPEIVARLVGMIRQIQAEQPGRPVVLSPFHYISEYLNIQICDAVRAALGLPRMAVVSAIPADVYGVDSAMIPDLDILQTSEDNARQTMGLAVVRAMRRQGVVAIFTDIPPFALLGTPRKTTDVQMFSRPARIHQGVFQLGASQDAVLLPFFLRLKQGRIHGQIYQPITLRDPDAPQQTANAIEDALCRNYAQWLPAGHPSFYWFSPTR